MPSLFFPSVGLQILSSLIHFLGVSVLSHCLSRRIATENFTTLEGLSNLTWARICIILVFFDSWLFLFASGILVFGIGLELSPHICKAAAYACICSYSCSKVFIYAFLIERVHVVWTPAAGVKRFKSPVYIICFVTISIYAVVIAMMFVGRQDYIREDGVCIIGLRYVSSLPLLVYDLYVNIFLTALFLHPLLKTTVVNPRIRRIARRALLATAVALTTSTANIAVMAVLKGRELAWLCLGSCGADVIVNAVSLFWVTSTKTRRVPITTISLGPGQNNSTTSQPIRSILKRASLTPLPQAVSPTNSRYMSGPHPITAAYYHYRDPSPSFIPETKEAPEPEQPPLQFDISPRSSDEPESEANMRASPVPSARLESPSALQSLISLILDETRTDESIPEIQIRITTDVDVQSLHDTIDEEDSGSLESHISRAHSV